MELGSTLLISVLLCRWCGEIQQCLHWRKRRFSAWHSKKIMLYTYLHGGIYIAFPDSIIYFKQLLYQIHYFFWESMQDDKWMIMERHGDGEGKEEIEYFTSNLTTIFLDLTAQKSCLLLRINRNWKSIDYIYIWWESKIQCWRWISLLSFISPS